MIYHDEEQRWWINHTPGKKGGCATPAKTAICRRMVTGNMRLGMGSHGVMIGQSPSAGVPCLPRPFTVTASGAASKEWPDYLGQFTRTQRWWRGRPVYTNTQGRLLYHSAGYEGWVIGPALGFSVLRGSQSHMNPSLETTWTYWTGTERKPASVTVTGTHTQIS